MNTDTREIVVKSQRCPICHAPLAVHMACERCGVLIGPGHPGGERQFAGRCVACAPRRRSAKTPAAADQWLDVRRVAEVIGRKPRTIRAWIRAGTLKARSPNAAGSPNGHRWLIYWPDVVRLLDTESTTTYDHLRTLPATPEND